MDAFWQSTLLELYWQAEQSARQSRERWQQAAWMISHMVRLMTGQAIEADVLLGLAAPQAPVEERFGHLWQAHCKETSSHESQ